MELNKIKIMVAGSNSNGEADFFVCTVEANEDQVDAGEHYDMAKELAESSGFESPFVYFDNRDQANIARNISELDCPIPFALEEKADGKEGTVSGNLLFGYDGVSIQLDGYTDHSSIDDKGIVAFLEYWDGSINLRAYADINIDEPTHSISLEGAKNECRNTEETLLSVPSIQAKDLWSKLGDIPVLENGEIEEEFLHFEIGTDRETIWDWFESTFKLSVAEDLMGLSK